MWISRHRLLVLLIAVVLLLGLAAPAGADSWQEGMLPAPPTGEEAPYYHGMGCDINGDGVHDRYGQEYVTFLWKADGKINKDGFWEGKVRFKLDEVVYDYLPDDKPGDLPDALVVTGFWVIDGVFESGPGADLTYFLENATPIDAELDWDLKLFDQDGVFIAKTGGIIDFISGEMDWYGPCNQP